MVDLVVEDIFPAVGGLELDPARGLQGLPLRPVQLGVDQVETLPLLFPLPPDSLLLVSDGGQLHFITAE